MMQDLVSVETAHGALTFDAAVGNIPRLRLKWDERWIEPLHNAPWRDEPAVQANAQLPPVDRRLAGDFFCAPFASAADPGVPPHGWTANSQWDVAERRGGWLRAVLGTAATSPHVPLTLTLSPHAGSRQCHKSLLPVPTGRRSRQGDVGRHARQDGAWVDDHENPRTRR